MEGIRPYRFSWDFIGNVQEGRPHLGNMARIEIYRLFQYTLRDVLEERLGTEGCDKVLYQAGYLAGRKFCEKYLMPSASFDEFLDKAEHTLAEWKMGILRVEEALPGRRFVLTVAEDLDCSGLPDVGHAVCTYDEGFLAGLFQTWSGHPFQVRETDCWCTGDRTCRFEVAPLEDEGHG